MTVNINTLIYLVKAIYEKTKMTPKVNHLFFADDSLIF